jgi:hypothetical protein
MATYSVLGKIVERYDNSSSDEFVALRAAVGADKLWTDIVPEELTKPYVSVSSISTTPESQGKANSYRIDRVNVQFSTYDTSLSSVDNILELLENAILRTTLTEVTDRETDSFPVLVSRESGEVERRVYRGILEVSYLMRKSPV